MASYAGPALPDDTVDRETRLVVLVEQWDFPQHLRRAKLENQELPGFESAQSAWSSGRKTSEVIKRFSARFSTTR